MLGCREVVEPSLRGRAVGGAADESNRVRDCVGHEIEEREAAGVALGETGGVEVGVRATEQFYQQLGFAVLPLEVGVVEVGHLDRVAGRADHDVELLGRPVDEVDVVPVEVVDIGADHEVTVAEVVEDLGVDDRVRLEEFVVRLRQSEAFGLADDEAQQRRKEALADGHRKFGATRREHIGRDAEDMLREGSGSPGAC